jgi:outer membrane receptor protein involved in Fe transport
MQAGCTNILLLGGGNDALKAQKATTWSFGMEFQPQNMPTLRATANYYYTVFKDRIQNPTSLIPTLTALGTESFLGPQIVQRNPSAAVLQAYLANPLFSNPLDIDVSTIGAIVDSRVQNLSRVTTSGLDLGLNYEASTAIGVASMGFDATYILKFDNQFSAVSPTVGLLNTQYNPLKLKARAHVALTRGPLSLAVLVNYVSAYENSQVSPEAPVSSWTTADLSVGFVPEFETRILQDTAIRFSVKNLFNKDPPYLANPLFPVNFDGANADVLGRVYALQLSKRF